MEKKKKTFENIIITYVVVQTLYKYARTQKENYNCASAKRNSQ